MFFTKIASMANNKKSTTAVPLTPDSEKPMPKFYKTAVALRTWGLSGLAFGVTGFTLLCYLTEWRTVLQFMPYYNGKYKELEKSEAIEASKLATEIAERKENASRDFQHERDDILAGVQKEL